MATAEQRREARRRRILMNTEDRIKKIIGVPEEVVIPESLVDDETEACSPVTQPNGFKKTSLETEDSPVLHSDTMDSAKIDDEGWILGHTKHTTIKNRSNRENVSHSVNHSNHISSQTNEQLNDGTQHKQKKEVSNNKCTVQMNYFVKVRFLLCLMAGALVRVSLTHSFGQNYVQTSVYPFVALEIAFIGYQRATNMIIGDTSNTSGGLYVAALQLAGVSSKLIHTYKLLIGLIVSIAEDFAAFTFVFIITHVLIT